MLLGRKKRPGWEYFVIVLVVGSAMLLAAAIYAKRDQVAKERLLIWELLMLRNQVTAYIFENKTVPPSLEEVVGPSFHQDPFGYPYRYNPKTGWVSSITQEYQQW